MECTICSETVYARGWCKKHYLRWWRNGDPNVARTYPKTVAEAFSAHKPERNSQGCLLWMGNVARDGYGRVFFKKRSYQAHRVSYETSVGEIPAGMFVDHRCHNKRCIEPKHLRLVNTKQNVENYDQRRQVRAKSGVRGVWFDKRRNKYLVYVGHNGKNVYCGIFDSLADAGEAAIAARLRLHTHNDADRRLVS